MFKLLILPGDGIGPEVVAQAKKVIKALNKCFGLVIEYEEALIGGHAIDQCHTPIPQETLKLAQDADSVLLGAVGGPKWDHMSMDERPEKGLLTLRRELALFANLRPAFLSPSLVSASTLKPEVVSNLDVMIVRELTGGIYFGEPRGIRQLPSGEEEGVNTLVYKSSEIDRIAKVAFSLAAKRGKKLCSVDKANVLEVSQLWRKQVEKQHQHFLGVELTHMYVDNAAMQLVKAPKQFDVMVTSNMFGDILSDCAAMLTGSIGMLPSASLNDKEKGLYEPVHGSAPDIAGHDKANPLATLMSLAMCLRYSLNEPLAAGALEKSIEKVLSQGYRTLDIASEGKEILGTQAMGDLVVSTLYEVN